MLGSEHIDHAYCQSTQPVWQRRLFARSIVRLVRPPAGANCGAETELAQVTGSSAHDRSIPEVGGEFLPADPPSP